jgi:hypothetical protein
MWPLVTNIPQTANEYYELMILGISSTYHRYWAISINSRVGYSLSYLATPTNGSLTHHLHIPYQSRSSTSCRLKVQGGHSYYLFYYLALP